MKEHLGRLGEEGGGTFYAGNLLTVRCPSVWLELGVEGVCIQLRPEAQ